MSFNEDVDFSSHGSIDDQFILASTIKEMTDGSFGENFDLMRYLGGGTYGRVYIAQEKNNNAEPFVVKFIQKSIGIDCMSEVEIMKKTKGYPNVAQIIGDSSNSKYYQIFMSLDGKMSLAKYIKQHSTPCENFMRHVFIQISNAISFLHKNSVAHLDIKPQNIVINRRFDINLIDFGLAKDLSVVGDGPFKGTIGTKNFMAPEMLQEESLCYPKPADIWAVGVTLFKCFNGWLPYIVSPQYVMSKNEKRFLNKRPCSPELNDLLENMLQVDILKRYQSTDIMTHAWLKQDTNFDVCEYGFQEDSDDKSIGQVILQSEQSSKVAWYEQEDLLEDDLASLGSEEWQMPNNEEEDEDNESLGSDIWEMKSLSKEDVRSATNVSLTETETEQISNKLNSFSLFNMASTETILKTARYFITGALTLYHGGW